MNYLKQLDAKSFDSATTTVPAGFESLGVDFNHGAKGKYIYLYKKMGSSGTGVYDIEVTFGRNESYPSAPFSRLDVNFNEGTSGEYIWLDYRKEQEVTIEKYGIAELHVAEAKISNVNIPDGYILINKDFNKGARGRYIYLYYKRVIPLTDWMSELKQSGLRLWQVNIPGTHDSACFEFEPTPDEPGFDEFDGAARTQSKTFEQQLNYGVRFFDIRVNYNLNCVHGKGILTFHTTSTFNDFVRAVKKFLSDHNKEVVVVRLKIEPNEGNAAEKQGFIAKLSAIISDNVFWKGDRTPLLEAVRGKIVILDDFSSKLSKVTIPASLEVFAKYSEITNAQDKYNNITYEDKKNEIVKHIGVTNGANSENEYFLNYISMAVKARDRLPAPSSHASVLNPWIERYLASVDANVGIMVFDFINARLADRVILRNFLPTFPPTPASRKIVELRSRTGEIVDGVILVYSDGTTKHLGGGGGGIKSSQVRLAADEKIVSVEVTNSNHAYWYGVVSRVVFVTNKGNRHTFEGSLNHHGSQTTLQVPAGKYILSLKGTTIRIAGQNNEFLSSLSISKSKNLYTAKLLSGS